MNRRDSGRIRRAEREADLAYLRARAGEMGYEALARAAPRAMGWADRAQDIRRVGALERMCGLGIKSAPSRRTKKKPDRPARVRAAWPGMAEREKE